MPLPTNLNSEPMTSRIANIAVAANDPRALAEFWRAALGWVVVEEEEAGDDVLVSIGAEDGSWPVMDLLTVPQVKSGQNRLHLDLRADGSTPAEEVDRLLGLGARRVDVGQPADVSWVVLADPEGNEFCVLGRTVQQEAAGRG